MSEIEEQAAQLRRDTRMTDADKEEQRRSFAWGNINIENPTVTREMINNAAEQLKLQK